MTELQARIEECVKNLILAIEPGDRLRPGMEKTPNRVFRAIGEMFDGYCVDPDSLVTEFKQAYDQIIVSKDIDFYSFCEHHLLPFFGKVHVAYMPGNGNVVGLSKISRIVDCYAHRFQIQERLTKEIADFLFHNEKLKPMGVLVMIEAQHLCQTNRGARKPNAVMVTSVALGIMRDNDSVKAEALRMMGK